MRGLNCLAGQRTPFMSAGLPEEREAWGSQSGRE
jgi:hypothetical protein